MTHPDMRLVPVEPTPDMNISGGIAICAARETALTSVDEAYACYHAMLAAAQPQPAAREEAQPVGVVDGLIGRLNTAELDDGTPLYTHPAPSQQPADDKLRLAMQEAVDAVAFFDAVKAATVDEQIAVGRDHWNRVEAALRRLAALKAEGK